ncbi:MAG: 4a-hydroxytetrahydrobiopterin dehydratase [Actinomycetia bacterium]|nr:4a-hydroxytetrahydrobiopterin dehydratase [Actinomycetes bacterium]
MAYAPRVVSDVEFSVDPTLADWRVILRRAEAVFRAPSLAAAAAWIPKVIAAADAADHHPDIDLRYPGRLHVTLTTHATGGLTDLDVVLAREISSLAAAEGFTSEPGTFVGVELAIDAMDISAVKPFWQAVLGYVNDGEHALKDPLRLGPPVWFQQMESPRPQRNRIHVDVTVGHDVAEARLAAALAAGGTLVSATRARSFWVVADPEGNEACICTWQDRG